MQIINHVICSSVFHQTQQQLKSVTVQTLQIYVCTYTSLEFDLWHHTIKIGVPPSLAFLNLETHTLAIATAFLLVRKWLHFWIEFI